MSQIRMPSDANIARAFGATIRMTVKDRGLYLVIGRKVSPVAVINGLGGQVVMQIPNSTKVLAAMNVQMGLACRRHPEIAFAGPIAIDSERFSHFTAAAGLDIDPGSA